MTRKMVDVRLTIGSVLVQCLHRLLIQSDDHDVRSNVEFIAASDRMRFVRYPLATIHIGDSDTLHIRRSTGHAVLLILCRSIVVQGLHNSLVMPYSARSKRLRFL